MKYIADITLVENSTAGNPPKLFAAQRVNIRHRSDTSSTGVDGYTSTAKHPTEIEWAGGTAADLLDITDVLIATPAGEVLVDAALNTTFGTPRDISGGVRFFTLRGG